MFFSIFLLMIGALLSSLAGSSPIFGGALGFLFGWVYQLMLRTRQLEIQIKALSEHPQVHPHQEPEEASQAEPVVEPNVAPQAVIVEGRSISTYASSAVAVTYPEAMQAAAEPIYTAAEPASSYAAEPPKQRSFSLFTKAKDWLLGGNPFVRIGVVVLFFGVVFLLRYSIQHNMIPVELRVLGAATGALALLGFGWKLRERSGSYGLILQAGGIGLLYLTVFGAYSLYHLIPPFAAFALLLVIVLAGAALAILQNSLPLAVFATVGGFLAPLLTSSGSNNYIGLFSFYALLNLGIVVVAWFKSWRLLNLVGFVFTFVIASLWGWFSYRPEDFAATEGFLILFFLFYVLIAILFATRTPFNFKDKVDGTLVFGTPIIGFCMQAALLLPFMRDIDPSTAIAKSFLGEYGLALSSITLGVFYVLLAWGLWKRYGQAQQLLAESFLILGVIFTTLAIPFAVDGAITSAAWAIEGAGILWLGIRQQQLAQRLVAVALQFVALFYLCFDWLFSIGRHAILYESGVVQPFINGYFIAITLIAGAMLCSSYLLTKDFAGKRGFETGLAMALLVTALIAHFLGFEAQSLWTDFQYPVHTHLLYAAIVSGLMLVGTRSPWRLLSWILPLPMLLLSLALFIMWMTEKAVTMEWLAVAWIGSLSVWYFLQYRLEQRASFPIWSTWLKVTQSFTLWLVILLAVRELQFILKDYFTFNNAWPLAALPVIPLTAIWLVVNAKRWPMSSYRNILMYSVVLPLVVVLVWWFFVSLSSAGDPAPLPWLPLLNPLDLVTAWLVITLVMLAAHGQQLGKFNTPKIIYYSVAAICFIWLNVLVLRVLHHWYGLEWSFPTLLMNPITQTTLALVWTISGLILTWRGHRTAKRSLWTVGALLLGAVVLKLFIVDFASSGTVERIISFIGVGVLLLFIGYLAPLPPARKEANHV
jgi:uncharacterized membrane protein